MSDSEIGDVLARLDSLEKQNRNLRRWSGVSVLLALALGATAMAPQDTVPDVVRARTFILVDKTGNAAATLGFHTDLQQSEGTPYLGIHSKGESRLSELSSSGIMVTEDKFRSTVLTATHGPGGGFSFKNGKSKACATIREIADGVEISITDKDGKTVFKVPE